MGRLVGKLRERMSHTFSVLGLILRSGTKGFCGDFVEKRYLGVGSDFPESKYKEDSRGFINK